MGADGCVHVHVHSCAHYLYTECHQSYIKCLNQEDILRNRNDRDKFLAPRWCQLANAVYSF